MTTPEENKFVRFEQGTAADLEQFISGILPYHLAGAFLGSAPSDTDLHFLSFRGAAIGDAGIQILVASPLFVSVDTLCIECCGLSDVGVQFLASSPYVTNLRKLYLCNRVGVVGIANEISDTGAMALAASPYLEQLKELDLWKTNVGDAGMEALILSPHLSHLSSVTAWETRLTKEGAARIKELSRQRWAHQKGATVIYSCTIHTNYDERVITYDDGDNYS